MKLRIWLDSGANIHSKYEQVLDLEDLGISIEEWNSLSIEQKELEVKDIAFDKSDWGFEEIP